MEDFNVMGIFFTRIHLFLKNGKQVTVGGFKEGDLLFHEELLVAISKSKRPDTDAEVLRQ